MSRECVIDALLGIKSYFASRTIEAINDKNEIERISFLASQKHIDNAIELLKEQEVLEKRNEPIEPIKPEELWICGACGEGTVGWDDWIGDDTRYNYCPICGKAVKW